MPHMTTYGAQVGRKWTRSRLQGLGGKNAAAAVHTDAQESRWVRFSLGCKPPKYSCIRSKNVDFMVPLYYVDFNKVKKYIIL